MKIWDISRTLSDDFAEWPGDMPFHFELTKRIAEGEAVNLGTVRMSVHNGTHADGRFHFDPKGQTIEQVELASYLGPATIVDLTKDFSAGGKDLIEVDNLLSQENAIAETSRILIKTGLWNDSTIFPKEIPVITPEVAEWLQARGVKLFGVDLPSVDAIDAKILRNHHALASAGIAIIESLDLSDVEAGIYNFVALPLKIADGDGAPLRAIVWRD